MFRVLSTILVDHDWGYVALAAALSFLARLIAIVLLHHARPAEVASRLSPLWVIAAGVSVSCGIWATHYWPVFCTRPLRPAPPCRRLPSALHPRHRVLGWPSRLVAVRSCRPLSVALSSVPGWGPCTTSA